MKGSLKSVCGKLMLDFGLSPQQKQDKSRNGKVSSSDFDHKVMILRVVLNIEEKKFRRMLRAGSWRPK